MTWFPEIDANYNKTRRANEEEQRQARAENAAREAGVEPPKPPKPSDRFKGKKTGVTDTKPHRTSKNRNACGSVTLRR